MRFKVEITCDNAAFDDAPYDDADEYGHPVYTEVARILKELTGEVDSLRWFNHPWTVLPIRDKNGQTVGTAQFTID